MYIEQTNTARYFCVGSLHFMGNKIITLHARLISLLQKAITQTTILQELIITRKNVKLGLNIPLLGFQWWPFDVMSFRNNMNDN